MWNWLSTAPTSSRGLATLMATMACVLMAWMISWTALAHLLSIELTHTDPFAWLPCDRPGYMLVFFLVLQVLFIPGLIIEEACRLLPLWIVMQFARRSSSATFFQFSTSFACILMAAAYGLAHVEGLGVTLIHALLVQCLTGLLLNLLYLKAGGMSDSWRSNFKGFWVAYLFHLLWNWALITSLILYYAYVVFVDPSINTCE